MKTSRKIISLALSLSLFAMGCRSTGAVDSETGAFAVPTPVEDSVCVSEEVYNLDEECTGEEGATDTVDKLGPQSLGTLQQPAQCSAERAACIRQCNSDMESGTNTCFTGVAGVAAAEIAAFAALAGSFKAALIRACSAATWNQILRGSGIAILVVIVIGVLDWALWAACARVVRNQYRNCIASCPAT
jgi:hypothetical protein